MSMATLKTISAALKLVDTKKENLKKAYDDLQPHSSLLSSFPLTWSDLDSHFNSIHNSLTHRFHLLQSLESHQQQRHPPSDPTLQSISALHPPQTHTPVDPSSSSQHHAKNPKDPSPSSSKLPDPNPKDANLTSLPNDPSSSSNPLSQNGPGVSKSDAATGSLMPRHELSVLCEKMDGNGLRNYVSEHLKEKVALQAELPGALRCAPDPAAMILDSLGGFLGANGMKDWELRKMKRSCNILFQQLRVASPNMNSQVRERARKMAAEWKGRLTVDNSDAFGALAFLHFVAAYGLLSKLSMNELVNFSAMAAANDELPELYQIIGLTDKVPGLVKKLIDKGKHILAVKYVFEFNLADKIPPVPILKAYVNESNKLAKRLSQEGKSLSETTSREIHALKQVIKVIESHKLESEYPPASLEQRIEQLKKQKANIKHTASAAMPPQHQQQQQQQQQQQSGIKRPRTPVPVGPAAVLKNVSSANSTMHQYQQPLFQSTGLLPEHSNPYISLPAMPFGMVAPTPTISPYTGASTGPYGLAGVPMGPSGNPGQGGSYLNSSELHVPSGYYDRVSAYGGYGPQNSYQTSYPQ